LIVLVLARICGMKWSDIDFRRKRVRVTAKKRLGFKPNGKEDR